MPQDEIKKYEKIYSLENCEAPFSDAELIERFGVNPADYFKFREVKDREKLIKKIIANIYAASDNAKTATSTPPNQKSNVGNDNTCDGELQDSELKVEPATPMPPADVVKDSDSELIKSARKLLSKPPKQTDRDTTRYGLLYVIFNECIGESGSAEGYLQNNYDFDKLIKKFELADAQYKKRSKYDKVKRTEKTYYTWHISAADVVKLARYVVDNADEVNAIYGKKDYELPDVILESVDKQLLAISKDVEGMNRITELVTRGNVTFDELKEPTIHNLISRLQNWIKGENFQDFVFKSFIGVVYNVISAYVGNETEFITGTIDDKALFERVCQNLKINPAINQEGESYRYEMSPTEYLKFVVCWLETNKKIIDEKLAKCKSPQHGEYQGAGSVATYNGESLNYGAEILQPSNDDIATELALVNNMSYDERHELRIKINQLDLRRLLAADGQGGGFICPICGNGSGDNGDGVLPTLKTDNKGVEFFIHHCFKCGGFNGKVTDIIAELNQLEWNATRVLAIGLHLLKLSENSTYTPPAIERRETSTEISQEYLDAIQNDITSAQNHLNELPVEDRRGLMFNTLQHFKCGYLPNWTHPKVKTPPSRRLIIPTSSRHYVAVIPKRDRHKVKKKYWKQHAGSKEIFNSVDIVADAPCIVLEGEIDCMSIWQACNGKYHVIALGGAGEKSLPKLLDAKKLPCDARMNFFFVILFDSDSAGRTAAPKLVKELIQAGYPAVAVFLTDEVTEIDANDILTREGDAALSTRITELMSTAESQRQAVIDEIKASQEVQSQAENEVEESADVADVEDADHCASDTDKKELTTQMIFPNCPVDLVLPAGYKLNRGGLWLTHKTRKGDFVDELLSPTPMLITECYIYVDNDGTDFNAVKDKQDKYFYRISYYNVNQNKWIGNVVVSGADIANANSCCKLSSYGMSVAQSKSKYISEFFTTLRALPQNLDKIPSKKIATSTGWLDEACTRFLYPAADNAEYILKSNAQDYKRQFAVKGSYDEWKKQIIRLYNQHSPVFNITFATALAAPLIKILGVRNQQLLLWCKTGAGKSACVKAAMSAFGAPERLKQTFNGTKIGLDSLSVAYDDLPVWIDEFQCADQKLRESADQMIYDYPNGVTRLRADKNGNAKETKQFNGTRIFTGEQPILKDSSNAGAENRLLQISTADIFDEEISPRDVHSFFDANHGHFGRNWIDFIAEHKDEVKNLYQSNEKIFQKIEEKQGLMNNWGSYFAVVTTALQLAIPLIGAYSDEDVFNHFVPSLQPIIADIPRKDTAYNWQRALDGLSDYVASHPRNFQTEMHLPNELTTILGYKDVMPANVVQGYILYADANKSKSDALIAFIPSELKKILERELQFPSARAIIREFADNKVLELPPRQHPKRLYQKQIRLPRPYMAPKWLYVIKGDLIGVASIDECEDDVENNAHNS